MNDNLMLIWTDLMEMDDRWSDDRWLTEQANLSAMEDMVEKGVNVG